MNNICETCLSTDRRLFHLENWKITGFSFQFNKESRVCWECKRSLSKIQNFRQQALKARRLLCKHDPVKSKKTLTCLSSLTISHKDTYDVVCHHSDISSHEHITVKIEPADIEVTLDTEPTEWNPNETDTVKIEVKPDTELLRATVRLPYEVPARVSVQNDMVESIVDETKSSQQIILKNEAEETAVSSPGQEEETPSRSDDKVDRPRDATGSTKPLRDKYDRSSMYLVKSVAEEEMLEARQHQRSQKRFIQNQFKCETCILGFLNQKNLERHIENKHLETAGNFMCKVCTQRFKRENDAHEHFLEHYRFYRCSKCDFSSPKLDLVDAHYEAKHDSQRVYACLKCDAKFPTRRKKKTHIQAVHRAPVCPKCNKNFSSSSNLKKHLLTHADLPKLECPTCHKLYKTESTLSEHRRTHSPRAPPEDAYCAECDIRFANRLGLYSHMKHSSRHGALRYECDHCGKKFTGKYAIEYHMEREHLRILKYECEHCHRKFASHTQRRKHINKVHKKKGIDERTACDICGKVYANPGSCKKHRLVHTGERPHQCQLCPMAFSQRCVLRRHVRGVHKVDLDPAGYLDPRVGLNPAGYMDPRVDSNSSGSFDPQLGLNSAGYMDPQMGLHSVGSFDPQRHLNSAGSLDPLALCSTSIVKQEVE